MKHNCEECQGCKYYDKVSNFCGVCMKKIMKEVKENYTKGGNENGNRQNENESNNQTV